MREGSIFFARQGGSYVLKFVGEVRLTLCTSLDRHLEQVLSNGGVEHILVDLTETDTIDSTSLGLIAKLAVFARRLSLEQPTLVSTNEDVTRILDSMGFERIFLLLNTLPTSLVDLKRVPFVQESEAAVRERIIDAHKVLMSLNESNREAFVDLVTTLECYP
ncbi:STAS domain-containing protein [Marinobacterium aestuariivivens]|uniref:STAS domain-containing protein n=1 Tax=Marinobacterium aestuariivivens TaxID=1698799 RepID=A0ABW1ZTP8_9GAMM